MLLSPSFVYRRTSGVDASEPGLVIGNSHVRPYETAFELVDRAGWRPGFHRSSSCVPISFTDGRAGVLGRWLRWAAVGAGLSVACFAGRGGAAQTNNLTDGLFVGGWCGILQSAGLLFFAFAGCARIATIGEEVKNPERTIPRAILTALAIALVIYALIAVTALLVVGATELTNSTSPPR